MANRIALPLEIVFCGYHPSTPIICLLSTLWVPTHTWGDSFCGNDTCWAGLLYSYALSSLRHDFTHPQKP